MEIMKKWQDEKEDYKVVNNFIKKRLRNLLKSSNIKADVKSRIKEDLSLKRKIIRKGGDSEEVYNSIVDKSGLRIICSYISDLDKVVEIIESSFAVLKKEDKREELDIDTMGYQAIHLDVRIKKREEKLLKRHLELISEIQVKTALQTAWGENSHELTYKNIRDIPQEIKRRINLLNAIIEVADNEFDYIYQKVINLDTLSIYGIYFILVDIFYRKFKIRYNSEFTLFYITIFFDYYRNRFSARTFNITITKFINEKIEEINYIFKNRKPIDDDELFFMQPEIVLIYYSLIEDKHNFIVEWEKHFNKETLDTIASWFGISLV